MNRHRSLTMAALIWLGTPLLAAVQAADGQPNPERIPLIDVSRQTHRRVIVEEVPGNYMGQPDTVLLRDNKTILVAFPLGHGGPNTALKRSTDGGLTWSDPREIGKHPKYPDAQPCEPGLIRSPDGKQILCLARENSRKYRSLWMVSNDEGKTWSDLEQLPIGLTGDRHIPRYTPDGRLITTIRDMDKGSPTYGDFVLWVGTYDDILKGHPGQYRVRLLDNRAGPGETGYSGLELLPDGTFVSTTYCDLSDNGRKDPVVVSVRFKMEEFDRLAAQHIADARPRLVASIDKVILRRGRDGSGPTWFHPRACIVPGQSGPMVFMTLQTISGSDYFGPVHWMTSRDLGRTWTDPRPVPALGRVRQPGGAEEGVCDVVPTWHPQTKTVLALGHNVFYSGRRFSGNQPPRWPVYAVWRDGRWGPRRKLVWDDPRGAYIYTNGCGQRVVLPNGDILLAFTHTGAKTKPRSVSSLICRFDGETLSVKRVGDEIAHDKGRGLLEPSLVQFGGRFLLTLRAEDGHGYVSASDDGLKWTPKQPWAWDDGKPLAMSTTQQHWLPHSEALWLVYTRKDVSNVKVIRWRSPLWMAQVDTKSLRLHRDTERVVLPLVGDGVNDPNRVALMGNFHTVNVGPVESWVTVGEWQPRNGIKGDLLLARIHWARPNMLAP